jgi:tetratricopeptide (TPR) repeat protein
MINAKENRTNKATASRRPHTVLLSLILVVGLGSAAMLNRWLETNRPPVDSNLEQEKLYVTGNTARRMSLAFNGLIADWYWMRALQYVGRKIIAQGEKFQFSDLASLDLKLLYPLLDAATTLDPQFIPVYEYGGVVLPAINDEDAIKLLKKGIENNPTEWRLYHHLGYIYWQRKDYPTASTIYAQGATLHGAPAWMQAMSARMLEEGGTTDTAREMYMRIYEQSEDGDIRRMAELHLMQLDSADERKAIQAVLKDYLAHHGRCASEWREVSLALRAARVRLDDSGTPLDPADVPYLLVKDRCDVELGPGSPVPSK